MCCLRQILAASIVFVLFAGPQCHGQEPSPSVSRSYSETSEVKPFSKQWRAQQAMLLRQMQLQEFTLMRYSPARPTVNALPYFQTTAARPIFVSSPFGVSYYYPGTYFSRY